ncbi:hypothetical protein HOLleu_43477 [Holothuria leucospilota]|uniref:Uncharacterized protein n=1 Tax=Holothuria leucospilota TaxID=206669 RepID=A0A9Q0YBJ7_HOLLE|nr:hypothetical protein HOLleu_43477 [Holothuria leucospilota]
MKKCGENLYKWPGADDISWEARENLVCKPDFPEPANKRGQFKFSNLSFTNVADNMAC